MGIDSLATDTNAAAFGRFSAATAADSTALGSVSKANGDGSTAVGPYSKASGAASLALGRKAVASKSQSVTIGSNSIADAASTVSVGRKGSERRIVNVAAEVKPTDAVNLNRVKTFIAAATATRQPSLCRLRRNHQRSQLCRLL